MQGPGRWQDRGVRELVRHECVTVENEQSGQQHIDHEDYIVHSVYLCFLTYGC